MEMGPADGCWPTRRTTLWGRAWLGSELSKLGSDSVGPSWAVGSWGFVKLGMRPAGPGRGSVEHSSMWTLQGRREAGATGPPPGQLASALPLLPPVRKGKVWAPSGTQWPSTSAKPRRQRQLPRMHVLKAASQTVEASQGSYTLPTQSYGPLLPRLPHYLSPSLPNL